MSCEVQTPVQTVYTNTSGTQVNACDRGSDIKRPILGCAESACIEKGFPNQIAGFKLSCDMKVICIADRFCACAVQQNWSA